MSKGSERYHSKLSSYSLTCPKTRRDTTTYYQLIQWLVQRQGEIPQPIISLFFDLLQRQGEILQQIISLFWLLWSRDRYNSKLSANILTCPRAGRDTAAYCQLILTSLKARRDTAAYCQLILTSLKAMRDTAAYCQLTFWLVQRQGEIP